MYIDVIVIRIIRAECCRTVAIAAMIFHLYQTHAHAFLAIDNVMWYGRCSWCPRNWSHSTLFWRLINYLLFLSTSLHFTFTFTHEREKKTKNHVATGIVTIMPFVVDPCATRAFRSGLYF